MGVETVKKYNKKAQKAIDSFFEKGESVAIIGRGRRMDEKSLVLVENGNYLGFGFFDKDQSIGDLESAKNYIKIGKENRVAQNMVNSFLMNPKDNEVVTFE